MTAIMTEPTVGKRAIFRGTTSKKPKIAAQNAKFLSTVTSIIGGS